MSHRPCKPERGLCEGSRLSPSLPQCGRRACRRSFCHSQLRFDELLSPNTAFYCCAQVVSKDQLQSCRCLCNCMQVLTIAHQGAPYACASCVRAGALWRALSRVRGHAHCSLQRSLSPTMLLGLANWRIHMHLYPTHPPVPLLLRVHPRVPDDCAPCTRRAYNPIIACSANGAAHAARLVRS